MTSGTGFGFIYFLFWLKGKQMYSTRNWDKREIRGPNLLSLTGKVAKQHSHANLPCRDRR